MWVLLRREERPACERWCSGALAGAWQQLDNVPCHARFVGLVLEVHQCEVVH